MVKIRQPLVSGLILHACASLDHPTHRLRHVKADVKQPNKTALRGSASATDLLAALEVAISIITAVDYNKSTHTSHAGL